MATDAKSTRIWALVDLVLIIGIFLFVREYAKSLDLIGAGSMGIVAAVIVGTVSMKLRRRNWTELGTKLPRGGKEWMIAIGITAGIVASVAVSIPTIIIPVIELLSRSMPAHTGGDHFSFFYGKPLVFATYMLIVVWGGAAFGEELFSRGLMMNRIAELFGSTKTAWAIALIGQSIFFGVAHAYQGAAGMVMTGWVGFVFGVFYLLGGRRLWPLFIAHGLINTKSLTELYLANLS